MATEFQKYKEKKEQKGLTGWEPPKATHPGAILKDMLEENDITQKELANRTGISKKTVNKIVNEKHPISQETASKLAKVFEEKSKFWIDLQKIYELNRSKEKQSKKAESEADKYINEDTHKTYRQLANYKLVEDYYWSKSNYNKIISELQQYFGVDSLDYLEKTNLKAAFRKYEYQGEINNYSLAAWLRLGRKKARQTEIPSLNKTKLKNSLREIRSLSTQEPEDYLPKLEQKLADCGIVLIYAPYFKNTGAQGATQWIRRSQKAFIILKSENQTEDKFWFNLFHEIGHLLKHSKKELFIDFNDDKQESKTEQEANEFAEKKLIPNFESLVEKYEGTKQAINKIAEEIGIAPSIVAGRISHEHKDEKSAWQAMSEYKSKINYLNIQSLQRS